MNVFVVITDAVVEGVMNDLLSESVAVIETFSPNVREEYMTDLRRHVRNSLESAFGVEQRVGP